MSEGLSSPGPRSLQSISFNDFSSDTMLPSDVVSGENNEISSGGGGRASPPVRQASRRRRVQPAMSPRTSAARRISFSRSATMGKTEMERVRTSQARIDSEESGSGSGFRTPRKRRVRVGPSPSPTRSAALNASSPAGIVRRGQEDLNASAPSGLLIMPQSSRMRRNTESPTSARSPGRVSSRTRSTSRGSGGGGGGGAAAGSSPVGRRLNRANTVSSLRQ